MRAVNEFFYKQNIFRFLDYSATGNTYEEGGVVIIDIELYSKEAVKLQHEIKKLKISFGVENQNITQALFQLAAEEPNEIVITNKNKVLQELEMLDETPWQNIQDLETINTRAIRRSHIPIYLTSKKIPKPRELRFSLTLDTSISKSEPELTPLFALITKFLLQNILYFTGMEYGLYANQISNKRTGAVGILLFTKKQASDVNIEKISSSVDLLVKRLLAAKTIDKLVSELGSIDYQSHYYMAPDYEKYLHDTDILIGQEGWKRIATRGNINLLIRSTTLEVKVGHQQSSTILAP